MFYKGIPDVPRVIFTTSQSVWLPWQNIAEVEVQHDPCIDSTLHVYIWAIYLQSTFAYKGHSLNNIQEKKVKIFLPHENLAMILTHYAYLMFFFLFCGTFPILEIHTVEVGGMWILSASQ